MPSILKNSATSRTRAIILVHYAGIACEMTITLAVVNQHGLAVMEDVAHAIDSYYCGQPLGMLGTLGAFSFHETKNIISGEGGMLVIDKLRLGARAEVTREKGIIYLAFYQGKVDKYGWVDVNSSFLPPDIITAYLWAQIECFADVQGQRRAIWQRYYAALVLLSRVLVCSCCPATPPKTVICFTSHAAAWLSAWPLVAHLKGRGI